MVKLVWPAAGTKLSFIPTKYKQFTNTITSLMQILHKYKYFTDANTSHLEIQIIHNYKYFTNRNTNKVWPASTGQSRQSGTGRLSLSLCPHYPLSVSCPHHQHQHLYHYQHQHQHQHHKYKRLQQNDLLHHHLHHKEDVGLHLSAMLLKQHRPVCPGCSIGQVYYYWTFTLFLLN